MPHRRRITTIFVALAGLALAGALAAADTARAYLDEIESWRSGRIERLQRPDGWLTLVGLAWLQPGDNSVGSAADSAVELPKLRRASGGQKPSRSAAAPIAATRTYARGPRRPARIAMP